jgi:ABC-type maltose transport system permease subunit
MEVNMSLLQETIVYIWLIPVVAQIIIPLAMLVGWSITKVLNSLFTKISASTEFAGSDLEPA